MITVRSIHEYIQEVQALSDETIALQLAMLTYLVEQEGSFLQLAEEVQWYSRIITAESLWRQVWRLRQTGLLPQSLVPDESILETLQVQYRQYGQCILRQE